VREWGSRILIKNHTIVSLYRDPPRDGMVGCMDEMGPLATIPRGGRSWGRKPARRSGRYHRSKTIQLLAGFAPRTGQGLGFPNSRKTGEDVLGFLQNTLLPRYCTHGKIYLVWDNFSAHRRPLNLWRPMPDNVEFVWTPTNAPPG